MKLKEKEKHAQELYERVKSIAVVARLMKCSKKSAQLYITPSQRIGVYKSIKKYKVKNREKINRWVREAYHREKAKRQIQQNDNNSIFD